jgi:hypothetical protein
VSPNPPLAEVTESTGSAKAFRRSGLKAIDCCRFNFAENQDRKTSCLSGGHLTNLSRNRGRIAHRWLSRTIAFDVPGQDSKIIRASRRATTQQSTKGPIQSVSIFAPATEGTSTG